MRNIDEQIIEERVDLFLVVAKEFRVITELLYPMQGHAPMNAAKQGCVLIAAEIDASLFSNRKKYARHVIGLRINCFLGCRALTIDRGQLKVRMFGNAPNFLRNLARRKGGIDKARANGTTRHRIKFRAPFALRESQPARRFDCAQTGCSVGAASGQDDADRSRASYVCQRFKKMVDCQIELLRSANQCQ